MQNYLTGFIEIAVDNITSIFSDNLRLLCSNSDMERHYYDAKLCLLDYLSCLVGGKGGFQKKLNTSGLGEGVQTDALKSQPIHLLKCRKSCFLFCNNSTP